MALLSKKIVISVINDLVTDQRVNRVATTLSENGYDVLVIGRKLPESMQLKKRIYKTKRFRLLFRKGPFFYLEINIRLFVFLIFYHFDIALSNDLDTLLANYWITKIKRKKLVYDSHEIFTEVPELIDRSFKQNLWRQLEIMILPKLKNAYTVNNSVAQFYYNNYNIKMHVVRNVPILKENNYAFNENVYREKIKTIIYQGAVNVGRGIELMIKAMQFIENAQFIIIGDGDIREDIVKLINQEKLEEKVKYLGRIPFEELSNYTTQADLGVSLEEDRGLNYRYALPNKIFDYIHAGIPILASNLPEIKSIVEDYNIGRCTFSRNPKEIANLVNVIFQDIDQYKKWKENTEHAKNELNWDREAEILLSIFENAE